MQCLYGHLSKLLIDPHQVFDLCATQSLAVSFLQVARDCIDNGQYDFEYDFDPDVGDRPEAARQVLHFAAHALCKTVKRIPLMLSRPVVSVAPLRLPAT